MAIILPTAMQEAYDVVVVGSGAGGGQAAYTLTMSGVRVLMLEAAADEGPEVDILRIQRPSPPRGGQLQQQEFGVYDCVRRGGWRLEGEPYTVASDEASRKFYWWRARALGGRTNYWGQICLRKGPYDFKPASRDGLGFNWPMEYADLAPYYDKVEMLIGVYGSNEGLENAPDSPEGCLMPAPQPRPAELFLRQRASRRGIPVIPLHRALMTAPFNPKRTAQQLHPDSIAAQRVLRSHLSHRNRCRRRAFRDWTSLIHLTCRSTTVHLPVALATGNLDIVLNAMVRNITLGRDGKADGVIFIDRASGTSFRVSARVIVLAASACESVRVLLNSTSDAFPNGLANSSGRLGRYIMDTVGTSLSGQVPLLENLPVQDKDGIAGAYLYIPWWLYGAQKRGECDFARGYHIELGNGRPMPSLYTGVGLQRFNGGRFGQRFKDDVRRYYGSFVSFEGRGEMIPNDDCFCEIDPQKTDQWGIPVLRFHWKWSEQETRQATHMQRTFGDLIKSLGGMVCEPVETDGARAIAPAGTMIHELGGAMMGSDPRSSVTNQWCQTWDVSNLFVTDGATFCSNCDKNPTLTIMALAWRAADYIIRSLSRMEL